MKRLENMCYTPKDKELISKASKELLQVNKNKNSRTEKRMSKNNDQESLRWEKYMKIYLM